MKYLFLDIDGVLATILAWDRPNYRYGREAEFHLPCQKLFEDFLVRNPDVIIILSSTWRKVDNWRYRIAKESPLIESRIKGITNSSPTGFRGDEIEEFVHDMAIDKGRNRMVILDDSDDFSEKQKRVHIQPDGTRGLEEKHIQQMELIFNGVIVSNNSITHPVILAQDLPESLILPKGWSYVYNLNCAGEYLFLPEYRIFLRENVKERTYSFMLPVVVYAAGWDENPTCLGPDEIIGPVSLG